MSDFEARRRVCYTGKDEQRGIFLKVIDTAYFFRRNRDLGTISVYLGYFYVRYLPPTYMYLVSIYIFPAN